MSNAHSARSVSTSHLLFYYLLILQCYFVLTTATLQPNATDKIPSSALEMYLQWPSDLGGPPVMMLLHFLYNGESDHLTMHISYYKYLWLNRPDLRGPIERILTLTISRHKPWKLLLSDPYSVCRDIPKQLLKSRIISCDVLSLHGIFLQIFR